MLDSNRLKRLMKEAKIPGVSIAFVDAQGEIYPLPLGVINQDHPFFKNPNGSIDVTPETFFAAASLSKPVFAYLVRKLIEANKVNISCFPPNTAQPRLGKFNLPKNLKQFDLDTPLYKILPELNRSKDSAKAKALTPRLALSHRTGIPISQGNGTPEFSFEPGTEYGYGGLSYLYLQIAIERLTDSSLQ